MLLPSPMLAITAAHTIVFGHSRITSRSCHSRPLRAALLANRTRDGHVRIQELGWGRSFPTLLLAGIWVRELLFVEGPRLASPLAILDVTPPGCPGLLTGRFEPVRNAD
jgi:hypothetical protein